MSLNFVIVVNDFGDLQPIQSAEIDKRDELLAALLDTLLNKILDERAIAAGEHDPSGSDTPLEAA